MKKHEACYWLNRLIEGKMGDLERLRSIIKEDKPWPHTDPATQESRDETENEATARRKFYQKELDEVTNELAALDIAASALTR